MDHRIKELADDMKERYGLDGYVLKRHRLRRSVRPFLKTVYHLELEWLPEETEEDEHGLLPKGAAIVALGVESGKLENLLFIGDEPSRGTHRFTDTSPEAVARWVESETDLVYGRQFRLKEAAGNAVQFEAAVHDIAVLPPAWIHVKWNEEGVLTSFMAGGSFPEPEMVQSEPFNLKLEQVEGMAIAERIEMPNYEQQRVHPYYKIKELNITQDGTALKFEGMNRGPDNLPVDEKLYWEKSADLRFEEQPVEWGEEITPDQAFTKEASPDARLFNEEDVLECKQVLTDLLSSVYPEASGKWHLTALQRVDGKIQAFLKYDGEKPEIMERFILAIMDGTDCRLLSYMDDKDAIEELETYERPEELAVTEQQAFEGLRPHLKLTPYYLPDHEQKRYRLYGILNCEYAVDAATGELVRAEEIQ